MNNEIKELRQELQRSQEENKKLKENIEWWEDMAQRSEESYLEKDKKVFNLQKL